MRRTEFAVDPGFERAQGAHHGVEPGNVDDAEAEDAEDDRESAFVERHFGADFVGPGGGDFADGEAGAFERVEKIDVERDVGDAKVRMNFFHGGSSHDFGAALSVFDAHAEEKFDEHVKHSAVNAAFEGLGMFDDGAFDPTGTDGAIDVGGMFDQIVEGGRGSGAIGIDVTDQVGLGPEAEAFNEGAAFADGGFEFEPANFGEISGGALDDLQGVVAAAVEDDDDLELAAVIGAEIGGVFAQNGADPLLLVVSGDEQKDAGLRVWH